MALGRDARGRLRSAVRALLDEGGLVGAGDAVRLAVLVLAARTNVSTGRVEMTARELGRWLGLSASYTASVVLPGLRASGLVRTEVVAGEFGQDAGLRCEVLPLSRARGVAGHVLALSRKELATWLRLLEAVFGPGWRHRDGSVTAAGLLGERSGRGAATDRLALLLLVLEAAESGRVRLCGGSVDTRRGRCAATLARLLGCSAAAGEGVLARLGAAGAVVRVRLRTVSGLAYRSRLLVPAVAAAHRRGGAAGVVAPKPTGGHLTVLVDPGVAAGPIGGPERAAEPQVSAPKSAGGPEIADPGGTAGLHAVHAGEVVFSGRAADACGFSGSAASGSPVLPERVCGRENEAGGVPAPRRPSEAGDGPLRGDKPKDPVRARKSHDGSEAAECPPGRLAALPRAARGRVPQPPDDVAAVVAVVGPLWERLDRAGARSRVVGALRAELAAAAGVVGGGLAERVMAERLMRRLARQGGPVEVTDPVGWLLGRGLPRRPGCGDVRCDDGARMDTGADCPVCAERREDRRAERRRIAAAVAADLPDVDCEARRPAFEARVRNAAMLRIEREHVHRVRAAEEQAARTAAVQLARAEQAAVEQALAEAACADCGTVGSGALCVVCGNRRAADAALRQAAAVLAAAVRADGGLAKVGEMAPSEEARLRADVDQAVADAAAQGAPEEALVLLARMTAEHALADSRREALAALGRSPAADAEAKAARVVARLGQRGRLGVPVDTGAVEAEACRRCAERLLVTAVAPYLSSAGGASVADTYALGAARVRAGMRARLVEQAV